MKGIIFRILVDTFLVGQIRSLRVLAVFGSVFIGSGIAQASVTDCDRLAASPADPKRTASGVAFSKLDSREATAACRKAVELEPREGRLWFQYGRALEKSSKLGESVTAYTEAIKLGHAASFNNLGELYRDGKHLNKDLPVALDLFGKSAELGSSEGKANFTALKSAMEDGAGQPIARMFQGKFSVPGMSCAETKGMANAFGGQFMGVEVNSKGIKQQMEFACQVDKFRESSSGVGVASLSCERNGPPRYRLDARLTRDSVSFSSSSGSTQTATRCNF